MAHAEIALHPIHGPDGSTAYPVGHPFYRDGDEKLPVAWDKEFVAEMVTAGLAAKPNSAAAKAIKADRDAAADTETTIIETGVRG